MWEVEVADVSVKENRKMWFLMKLCEKKLTTLSTKEKVQELGAEWIK